MMNSNEVKRTLNLFEVNKVSGIEQYTIYSAIYDSSLAAIKIGQRKIRICPQSLEDWLEYEQNEKFYKSAKIRKQRKPSESLRHPNLEYDDQEPDEDGLTFSSYHVLEW